MVVRCPPYVPTIWVLRRSGMNAVGNIADSIRLGAIDLGIAGGVESMSRAPFVMAKQTTAFGRNARLYDTTWASVPPASQKVLEQCGLTIEQMDVIELNEAFASQALATVRQLGVDDDAEHVNPNGGAIALGHPLGMSGARLVTTATYELRRRNARYALCAMCIGVGQGIAMIIERA